MKLFNSLLTVIIATCLTQTATAASVSEQTLTQWSNNVYWLKLGHYLPRYIGGYKSTIDSQKFFLAADGKTDPLAELKARYQAFYQADKTQAATMRCAYPARYTWLEKQQNRQPVLHCPDMERWRQVLDPAGMTLVFPTAFMNNPSSMFGHTLLRVDAKDQTRNKELVAFAINFAAEPSGNDNSAVYAIKGLIGSYPGRFSVMPYYRKVREYNDMESRDIWEYKLRFTPQEVNRVLLHLWEMQRAELDYFFFDENCSYQLLAILQLARPKLELVTDFPLQAIPSDTVATLEKNHLLEKPRYRPAFGTRLMHESQEVDDRLFAAAKKAKQGDFPSPNDFTPKELAAIYEFAYEWLNFEFYDTGLERDTTAKRLTKLLYQRSRLNVTSPFTPVPTPKVSPEKGHGSARMALGYNYSNTLGNSMTLQWRAAYHDLLDAPQGFIPGAQISFLDTQLSYNESGTARLDRLYVVDAMALAPSNRVFDSLAWNIRTGFDRQPNGDKLSGRWFAQNGYGKAIGQADKLHAYGLLSGEISGGQLTGYDATFGAGIEAGILWQASEHQRIALQGQYFYLVNADADYHSQANLSWQWAIQRNLALRTDAIYQKWHTEDTALRLSAYFYY